MRTSGQSADGVRFLKCGRTTSKKSGDFERHPTVVRDDLENAVVGAAVQVFAEQENLPIAEAETAFARMTLLARRAFAAPHRNAVVMPEFRGGRSVFTVNRKSALLP